MRNVKALLLTLTFLFMVAYPKSLVYGQANPASESIEEKISFADSIQKLWESVKRLLREGGGTEVVSPVELRVTSGANPKPVPVLNEESYDHQASGQEYKLSYSYGSGGQSSPPAPTPLPKDEATKINKSAGEVIGEKVDQTSQEVSGWAQDTNIIVTLVFTFLLMIVAVIFFIVRKVYRKVGNRRNIAQVTGIVAFFFIVSACPQKALAYEAMNSASYKIVDWDVTQGGGSGTAPSYMLQEAIGQSFQGSKTGAAYKIFEGIFYYEGALSLVCADSTVDIGAVTPGTPASVASTCTVTTDSSSGYKLYASENKDLEHSTASGTYIIPTSLGSYGSPSAWDTGTDLGLGFSLSGASVESKWASGGNFASFVSGTPGEINNANSAAATGANITFTYQLDVISSQKGGPYENEVYYYATAEFFQ